jgi:hypothetical protein
MGHPAIMALMRASDRIAHEQGFVRAFIQRNRQDRCLFLLEHPTRRRDFTKELAHFKWLEERYSQPVSSSRANSAHGMISLLHQKGASATVWIISEDPKIDATELPLGEAMEEAWGSSMGTILSCVPGRLAFFHGEEMKSERLLERTD